MLRTVAAWCSASLILSLASLAFADPPAPSAADVAAAAVAKRQGDEAMDGLHYDAAIAAYTKAYELGRDPAAIYNRGRVHEARGEYPEALVDLERFDREATAATKAKVPKLAELLAEVRAHVATLTIRCEVPGARVLVRGAVLGATPLADSKLNAGPAHLEVSKDDYVTFATDLVLAGGGSNVIDVKLTPKLTMGTLNVGVEGAPAMIFVDGARVGVTPVEITAKAGTHRVMVRRDSADDVVTSTVVEVGQRKTLHFDAAHPKPITSRWWFWTAAGVVVAGGVAGAIAISRTEKSPSNGTGFSPNRLGTAVHW